MTLEEIRKVGMLEVASNLSGDRKCFLMKNGAMIICDLCENDKIEKLQLFVRDTFFEFASFDEFISWKQHLDKHQV